MRRCYGGFVLLLLGLAPAAGAQDMCPMNVHVLLDASGSMRQIPQDEKQSLYERSLEALKTVLVPEGPVPSAYMFNINLKLSIFGTEEGAKSYGPVTGQEIKGLLDREDIGSTRGSPFTDLKKAFDTLVRETSVSEQPFRLVIMVSDFAHDIEQAGGMDSVNDDLADWHEYFENVAGTAAGLFKNPRKRTLVLLRAPATGDDLRRQERVLTDLQSIVGQSNEIQDVIHVTQDSFERTLTRMLKPIRVYAMRKPDQDYSLDLYNAFCRPVMVHRVDFSCSNRDGYVDKDSRHPVAKIEAKDIPLASRENLWVSVTSAKSCQGWQSGKQVTGEYDRYQILVLNEHGDQLNGDHDLVRPDEFFEVEAAKLSTGRGFDFWYAEGQLEVLVKLRGQRVSDKESPAHHDIVILGEKSNEKIASAKFELPDSLDPNTWKLYRLAMEVPLSQEIELLRESAVRAIVADAEKIQTEGTISGDRLPGKTYFQLLAFPTWVVLFVALGLFLGQPRLNLGRVSDMLSVGASVGLGTAIITLYDIPRFKPFVTKFVDFTRTFQMPLLVACCLLILFVLLRHYSHSFLDRPFRHFRQTAGERNLVRALASRHRGLRVHIIASVLGVVALFGVAALSALLHLSFEGEGREKRATLEKAEDARHIETIPASTR